MNIQLSLGVKIEKKKEKSQQSNALFVSIVVVDVVAFSFHIFLHGPEIMYIKTKNTSMNTIPAPLLHSYLTQL